MMKRLLIALAALSLFAGCAKNRDVELVRDGDKQNVLPKTAFIGANEDGSRGIWLTKMTIIDTSDAPAGTLFIGYQSDVQAGYFDFTEGQLQFRSLMGQLKGEESQNIKNNVLMNWNIEHIDYTLDESDGLTTNKEIEDNFKVWNQRRSFRIKWGEQKEIANQTNIFPISSFSVFECWSPVNIRRVDKTMKIEKDHIGFDVEVVYQRHPACGDSPQWAQSDFNFTATYKYSFRKLPETDYQPKAYTNEQDPARYKYGHFQTVRKVINPANGRPHNIFMENRWSEKTHTFYFVKDYPQKYKWIWDHTRPESVLGQTNALLKSVGSKLRFEIYDYNHDGVEREFGDLRYSFINFIEEIEAGGTPLGYGPSDANPFTGEILAANVMVWTGMLDFYLEIINDAGIAAEGESSLFRQLNAALKVNGNDEVDVEQMITDWDQTQGVGKFFKHMAQHTRYAYPGWNTYTMSQAGDVLVPTVVDKYQDGTFGVGSSSSNKVGLITSVLDLPVSKLPFDFETRMLSGRPQVKVRNPYDILDISWLERAANSNSVLAQNSGMYNFIHVLNNLRKISDRNYTGKDGLKNIAQDHYERELAIIKTNEQGHCIMDAEEFFGGFGSFLKATKLDVTDPEVRADILNNILYRVSIHEFGHNLNLRHNFYGSVDKANFTINTDSSIANFPGSNRLTKYTVTGEGAYKPVSGESRQQVSSSVMDYLRLEDELNTPWAWEEYDVATILDSYQPTKFDDKGHLYLFCTDEHTATSALCNRHDFGTTPSQILMSQIRSYDERYEMRNKRYGRAFWDTSGYVGGIFGTMLSMKEFLPMWRSAFAEDIVFKQLEVMGIKNKNEQKAYLEELNREMRKVMKITMAFYQAVIQQSRGDRDYRSEYDETTGALKQMGIISDKIYAMFFLAGDDAIFYNPNLVMLHNSFLTYSKEPGLAQFTDRIWRNMVTDRNIAMEPWFINFARFQYAKNATNYNNRDAANLINAMKIVRIENAKDLKDQYGVTMDVAQPAVRTRLPKSTTGTFNKGDDVVVVHVDGSYYMTSVAEGHVTFALFQDALDKIQGSGDDDQSITQFNMDVREFFWLYNLAQSGSLQ